MPTTFSNLVPVRRVAVGDCLGPQGRDGTDELTRTAFEALKAANWSENPSSPSFPVHEYDRAMPSGDAWKACYGYSASTRTQRAACGAVCYTFALPADATASGNVANVTKIALSVTGDRYLDAGADLHLLLSDSATPPTVAEWLAGPTGEIVRTELCQTSTQTAKPNERSGETAAVSIEPETAPASKAYLHVAILLHDYLGTRQGWIEGGAMLAGAAVAVTFSRDVAADVQPTQSARILLVTGSSQGTDITKKQVALSQLTLNYYSFTPGGPTGSDIATVVPLAFAGLLGKPPVVEWGFDIQASSNTLGYFDLSSARISSSILSFLYFSPPCGLVPGMAIPLPSIQNQDGNSQSEAGSFRAALVQVSAAASRGTAFPTETQISNLPAIDQVFTGCGPDIVAIGEYNIGADGSISGASMTVLMNPTKPYLAYILVPLGKNMCIVSSTPSVFVAS